jgi:hypothetical protein
MARVTQEEIKIGDDVSVDSPNTTLANWRAQSINVDGDNVRAEGLHRRNFAANAVVSPPGSGQYISASSGSMTVASSTKVLIEIPSGTPLVIGAFSIDAYATGQPEELMVFGSLQYRNGGHATIAGGGPTPVYNMCLSYSTNWNGSTGTWVQIDETLRKTGLGSTPSSADIFNHGSISWAHRLQLIFTTAQPSVYFGIQVWEPRVAKPITIEYVTLYAMTAKR